MAAGSLVPSASSDVGQEVSNAVNFSRLVTRYRCEISTAVWPCGALELVYQLAFAVGGGLSIAYLGELP